jgi:hypothetical protein
LQRKCHWRETTYMCFISIRSQNFLAIILCALALGKSHGDSNAYRRVDRKLKDDQQTCAATTCSSFNPDEGECNTFLDHSTTMHLWLPKFNVRKSENSTPGRFRCCVWQMSHFHLNRKAWTASTNALHQSATKTFMVKNPSRMEKSTIIDTGCSVFALGRTLWISILWIRTTHRHSHTCNSSFNTNTKLPSINVAQKRMRAGTYFVNDDQYVWGYMIFDFDRTRPATISEYLKEENLTSQRVATSKACYYLQ